MANERGERVYLTFQQGLALSMMLDNVLAAGYEEGPEEEGASTAVCLKEIMDKVDKAFGFKSQDGSNKP